MVWLAILSRYTNIMTLERLRDDSLFDTPARFTHLNKLRSQLGLSALSLPVDSANSTAATAGIEIEMTWRQAFKDMHDPWLNSDIVPRYDLDINSTEYRAFHLDYTRNYTQLVPRLHSITPVIPRVGDDSFWEFSFRPTKDPAVANAELTTLYDADILFEDIPYPTHMTLAGIPSIRDAAAILCRLEQEGGTTPERLASPEHSKKGTWMQKGMGGIRKRYATELEGSDTVAYEFRTLVTTSPEQMDRVFRLGQALAYTCLHDPDEWKKERGAIEASLVAQGLPLRMWGHPNREPLVWKAYRETLIEK